MFSLPTLTSLLFTISHHTPKSPDEAPTLTPSHAFPLKTPQTNTPTTNKPTCRIGREPTLSQPPALARGVHRYVVLSKDTILGRGPSSLARRETCVGAREHKVHKKQFT